MPPHPGAMYDEHNTHTRNQVISATSSQMYGSPVIFNNENLCFPSNLYTATPSAHKSNQVFSFPSTHLLSLNLEKKMLNFLGSSMCTLHSPLPASESNGNACIPKLKRTWLERHSQHIDEYGQSFSDRCDSFLAFKEQLNRGYTLGMSTDPFMHKRKFCLESFLDSSTSKLQISSKLDEARSKKKSSNTFLQDGPCWQVAPHLQMCRECQQQEKDPNEMGIFCRFVAFRRLCHSDGILREAGFSRLEQDCRQEDLQLWLPDLRNPTRCFAADTARFLIGCVGHQLCDLACKEQGTLLGRLPYWRRAVPGVREMCDVCQTTIFNAHWVCEHCGFVVCPDCFQSRLENGAATFDDDIQTQESDNKDRYQWLMCDKYTQHDPSQLLLAQIIANDALAQLNEMAHELISRMGLSYQCSCASPQQPVHTPYTQDYMSHWLRDAIQDSYEEEKNQKQVQRNSSLRQFLLHDKPLSPLSPNPPFVKNDSLYSLSALGCEFLPPHSMTLTQSHTLYPDVPHSWLCDGQLLLLHDPLCHHNSILFREQWRRGQPVMVSGIQHRLRSSLWTPAAFSRDFGHIRNDLINVLTGCIVADQPMRRFWEGFEDTRRVLKDEHGCSMVLKLKDWPPSHDFAELLPSRFRDLNRCLPLPEYTKRDGALNLAARLPDSMVRPDLGPKLYIAYGCAHYPSIASTNLHLDISDATNIMVYVCAPKDVDSQKQRKNVLLALDEAGCDVLTLRRVRQQGVVPGALWHIYHPCDADKIREFLNRMAIKLGRKLESNHDPIHDQSWYLDGLLREQLYHDYGVRGYAIVQCLGDAVFIPAGAPHQVRNLLNCIKVAEDFVSPENVSHCFHLTEQFRHLSEMHTNHEDKLQIKNIIYHTVKDAVSVLLSTKS